MCEGLLTDGLSCGDPAGDQSEQLGVTRPPWDPALGSSHTKGPSTCHQEVPFERKDSENSLEEEVLSHGNISEGSTDGPSTRSQKQTRTQVKVRYQHQKDRNR